MHNNDDFSGWLDPPLALRYLNGLADAVVVVDPSGRVCEGNPEFFRFTRAERSTMLGADVRNVLNTAPELSGFVETLLELAVAGVADRRHVAMKLSEGGARTFLLTGIPLGATDVGTLLAVRVEDISEMVRDRSEIEARHLAARESAMALERMNEELEGFSYSVAHDLRAPLRFIDKFAYLLMEHHGQELSTTGLQYAEQIREGSRQMAQLVEDLLEFSHITGQEMKREAIDMTGLAARVMAEVQMDLDEREILFKLGDLGTAYGDPTLVRQVVWNLVGNAVKFTRNSDEAIIELSRGEDEGVAVFTVSDNGVGFDAELADRLFTVFRRFHQPDEYEGSGVGLAVVQRIVSRHGGEAWAESNVGQGARFHFTLEPAVALQETGPRYGE